MALVDEGDIKNHVGAGEETGEMESVCVCVNLQLIRSTSCSQAEFISTVCSFFTGIIHSHFSSWSFTIQFNVRLLH